MADLYGSQDVTIRNDDGTKIVDVVTGADSINRLAVGANWGIGEFTRLGYVYSVNASLSMASADVDNPLILIKNPNGSGKTLYFYEFSFSIAVTNVTALFEVYQSPTITTNGTAMTITNRCVGGGFGASIATAYTLPTTSSNGAELMRYHQGQNTPAFRVADFAVILKPNNNLVITGNPSSNTRVGAITVVWAEF